MDVRSYELPEGASLLDRATLGMWKSWITWIRPLVLAVVAMGITSIVVGTTIARSGGYVAVWSPANYAAAVGIGGETVVPTAAWVRGIAGQFASVVAAAAVLWILLRRTPKPKEVGFISGLIVSVVHVSVSHQWGLSPVAMAPAGYQVIALIALWCLPIAGGLVGIAVERRRSREEALRP